METIKYSDILSGKNTGRINSIIANDGVLFYPTDTLYGMGGDFFSLAVIEKIDRLKQRKDMPYSVIVSGLDMLHNLVESVPGVFYQFYRDVLPGKFTFLFNASPRIDKALLKGSGKIGIRFPDVPLITELVETLGVPLITTSVNRSGQPALNDPAAITKEFGENGADGPLLLIDNGVLKESKGSTILDLTCQPVRCLRQGDEAQRLKEMEIEIQ